MTVAIIVGVALGCALCDLEKFVRNRLSRAARKEQPTTVTINVGTAPTPDEIKRIVKAVEDCIGTSVRLRNRST